jgi:hypothetical protein
VADTLKRAFLGPFLLFKENGLFHSRTSGSINECCNNFVREQIGKRGSGMKKEAFPARFRN